jgi:Ca2+-binding EF-hand superfamily protein
MERYDANNDRKVTQEEIDTNRKAWHKEFDANGDGKLSLDEFKQLWLKARARRIVREFQRFDRDGDASITQSEYLEPLADLVERRDRNGDGALSREDRRRHHKNRHRMMRRDNGREDAEEAPASENEN